MSCEPHLPAGSGGQRRPVRYLFAVIAHRDGPIAATDAEMVAIDAFNARLDAAGQRVVAVGVAAPHESRVVDGRDGAATVTIGPVVDADEFMAGFWIVEAEDDTAAQALALEASSACNRRIEVRNIL